MKPTFKTTDEIIKHAKSLIGETELYYVNSGCRIPFAPKSINIVPKGTVSSASVDRWNEDHDFCIAVTSGTFTYPAVEICKKRKPLECYVYVDDNGKIKDNLMVVYKPQNIKYKLFREVIEE